MLQDNDTRSTKPLSINNDISIGVFMKRNVIDFFAIILGTFIMALGIACFLLPNQLSSGGFSGITTVLYYLFDFKIGTTTLLMNIPLFIFAFFKLGRRFFIKAIFGTISFSMFLNFLEAVFKNVNVFTQDKLLSSIYGGLVVGVRNSNYSKI